MLPVMAGTPKPDSLSRWVTVRLKNGQLAKVATGHVQGRLVAVVRPLKEKA